jgi:hypothetical protein
MASEKQRNMMFYTKNMQINEKKMHFPRKREVHQNDIILMYSTIIYTDSDSQNSPIS